LHFQIIDITVNRSAFPGVYSNTNVTNQVHGCSVSATNWLVFFLFCNGVRGGARRQPFPFSQNSTALFFCVIFNNTIHYLLVVPVLNQLKIINFAFVNQTVSELLQGILKQK
jgi:hypothetical protein